MRDLLGSRMKRNYEDRYRFYFTRRVPVIVRLDGRAFHNLGSCKKPFDKDFMDSMVMAAKDTAKEMQGFKFGYVQSDEASFLLTDDDDLRTEGWFDYNLNKIVSISASTMTGYFNLYWMGFLKSCFSNRIGVFDGRAFNIPKEDVANYFLWRYKDWVRNSLLMYCQSFFSHQQLMNKSREDQHEMLHGIGKNWANDLTEREKNGTFLLRDGMTKVDLVPTYDLIDSLIYEKV